MPRIELYNHSGRSQNCLDQKKDTGKSRYFAKRHSSAECNGAEMGENVTVQLNFHHKSYSRKKLFVCWYYLHGFSDFQCVVWTRNLMDINYILFEAQST